MRYLIVIALLIFTGCAKQGVTPLEKSLYACMLITTVTDMITTDKILDQGGYELNPIIGDHPNNEALWMFAGGKMLIHSVLGYYSEFWRKWGWGTSCVMGSVLTIHNYQNIR